MLYTVMETKSTSKVPISPYGDLTFNFFTRKTDSLEDIFYLTQRFFVLNIPFAGISSFRCRRKIDYLPEGAYPEEIENYHLEYLFIDIDHINSFEERNEVLQWLEKQPFDVVVGPSRNPKNLKGVMRFNGTVEEAKAFLRWLNDSIPHGKFDLSVTHRVKFQSPSGQSKIFLKRIKGVPGTLPETARNQIVQAAIRRSYIRRRNEAEVILPDKELAVLLKDIKQHFNVVENIFKNGDVVGVRLENQYENTKGGYAWFFNNPLSIVHFNPEKSFYIGDIVSSKEGKEIITHYRSKAFMETFEDFLTYDPMKERNSFTLNYNFGNFYNIFGHSNKRYENKKLQEKKHPLYIEAFFKFFPYKLIHGVEDEIQCLVIQSPMNSGKSVFIDIVLKEAERVGKRVLLITTRKTLAEEYSGRYYNTGHYHNVIRDEYDLQDLEERTQKGQYPLLSPHFPGESHLAVQIDSLHKFDMNDYDIVIIDEFSSVIEKLQSVHPKVKEKVLKNLFSLTTMPDKKFLLMDAFLFKPYLEIFFPERHRRVIVNNEYKEDIEIVQYKTPALFNSKVIEEAKKIVGTDRIITVSSASKQHLRQLKKAIEIEGVTVSLIEAETPLKERLKTLGELNSGEKYADVYLYSPAITVGISIEADIEDHFHYDSGDSVSPLSSVQMLRRTRFAKTIHLFLKRNYRFNRTDPQRLRMKYEYISDPELREKMVVIDSFATQMKNTHLDAFWGMMKLQFNLKEPEIVEGEVEDPLKEQKKETKEERKEERKEVYEAFLRDNASGSPVEAQRTRLMRSVRVKGRESLLRGYMGFFEEIEKLNSLFKEIIQMGEVTFRDVQKLKRKKELVKQFKEGLESLKGEDYKKRLYFSSQLLKDTEKDGLLDGAIKLERERKDIVFSLAVLETVCDIELEKMYSEKDYKEFLGVCSTFGLKEYIRKFYRKRRGFNYFVRVI